MGKKPATALALRSFAFVVPHRDKADRKYDLPPHCGGEDAYFISDEVGFVGVADGVGGWGSRGVDPGIFSRQLMSFAAEEATSSRGGQSPLEVLKRAHQRTSVAGSSTALIMQLVHESAEGGAQIRASNLGDSGLLLLRSGEVLYQSAAQQHSFNFPYQLASPTLGFSSDSPAIAQSIEVGVCAGDVVVLGTDGLFDNAFAHEIAEMVRQAEAEVGNDPEALARRAATNLAEQAHAWSLDRRRSSPFAVEARLAGHSYMGGKHDDVTVLVSVVASQAQCGPHLKGSARDDQREKAEDTKLGPGGSAVPGVPRSRL